MSPAPARLRPSLQGHGHDRMNDDRITRRRRAPGLLAASGSNGLTTVAPVVVQRAIDGKTTTRGALVRSASPSFRAVRLPRYRCESIRTSKTKSSATGRRPPREPGWKSKRMTAPKSCPPAPAHGRHPQDGLRTKHRTRGKRPKAAWNEEFFLDTGGCRICRTHIQARLRCAERTSPDP